MRTAEDFEALADELKRLRADLDRVAKATETLVRDARADAMDAGAETWRTAKEKVEHQIEERPFASAAIALGVGLVLGFLVSGRR